MGNKVTKGTATGAIALAAFGVASGATVQAEELTKPSTTLSSDVTAPKAHNIKVLEGVLLTKDGAAVTTTPTEKTVEEAHGIKQQADQAVTDQAGKVAESAQIEANSQKAVEDANAKVAEEEKNKAAATPDAIAQVEKGVADTQKEIAQNQKASDTAANATQKATDAATTQKQAVEQAQKGVEAGQKAVDTAKKGVDTAKAALDGTGEQKALDEQKVANKSLEDAKKAESDATQNLAAAKKADADRHTQIKDLKDQATTQSKTATDTATDAAAKKAADSAAKVDVSTAKKVVETAQAALDGTGAQKVLDEQKAAEKALSDAKTKEVEAAQKLDEAKKADADRDAKIKNLTAKEAEQAAAKTDAENALAEAKKNAEAKKAAKEAAEAKRDALQKELDAKKKLSTITVPQYVIDAYKKYLNSDREEADKDALQDVFNKWIEEGAYDIERYGNVPIDPSTVDPAHMTREQAKALTQYYAHLITAVRRQFWGTKVKTYTTEEAMDYVQKVAEAYAKENKPWSSGHSHAALAAGERPSSKLTWISENIAGMPSQTTTMTEMYRFIAGKIINMMVNDYHSDFGHMSNMLGNEQDDDVIGVASSVTPNGLGRMHYVGFSDKYAGQALPDPYDTTQLEKDLAQAESDFQAALTAFNEANGVLTAKQAASDAAHQALSTTQSELATVGNQALQTPSAEMAHRAAVATRTSAETRKASADKAVTNLNASIQEKQVALQKAQAVLAAKEEAAQKAATALREAESKAMEAQQILNATKAKLAALTGVKDATPAASEALEKATTARNDAQARKDAADKAVANLSASIKEKQAALRTAEQALTAAENNLATLKASKASEDAKLVAAEQAVAAAKNMEAKLAAEARALESKLNDQQNLLTMYKNADKLLGEAVSKQLEASAKHKEAVARTLEARSKLAELLKDQRDANSQYEAVKKAYEEWVASKKAAEEKAQALSMRQTAKPMTTSKKIRPTIHSSYIYSRADKQLPQTGEKGSWLALIGGILASLSFGVRRKRGRN